MTTTAERLSIFNSHIWLRIIAELYGVYVCVRVRVCVCVCVCVCLLGIQ